MRKYKAIIVGGGPAGSMTALCLASMRPEMAEDILLLEAKSFPREKICGGGLSGRIVAGLESLGVSLAEIPKVSVDRLTICFGEERYVAPFGDDNSCVIRRSVFDELLLNAVREKGVEVRVATPAAGARLEKDTVVVTDRVGNAYHGEVMVGADGVNGRSRSWFGVPHKSRRRLLLQADILGQPDVPMLRGGLVMDYSASQFGVSGYAWFFPSLGREGEPMVNAGIASGAFARGSYAKLRDAFLAILDRHPEIKAMAAEQVRFKGYPERDYAIFQPKSLRRVLFVGDQLGADPFTGEGLSICADSATVAAHEILRALDSGNFSFKGYAIKLARRDFFPLLVPGKVFWLEKPGPRKSLMLDMATRKPRPDKENCMEIYVKIYSGSRPGRYAYSPYSLKTILRDLGGAAADRWLRR
jgi:flavin-dependent dehydrogenase